MIQTIEMSDGTKINLDLINSKQVVAGRKTTNWVSVYSASLSGSLLEGYGTTPDEAVADLYKQIRDEKRREFEAGLDEL